MSTSTLMLIVSAWYDRAGLANLLQLLQQSAEAGSFLVFFY
jgi:hypothetical protein